MKNCLNYISLSGNQLKIIAAVAMVIDHIGYLLFPDMIILRIIGRIAFPVFAFMIAEGCYYTKNKTKYFLSIFILGALCQIVYYFFNHSLEMGILITYSISILLIYLLDKMKTLCFADGTAKSKKFFSCFLFLAAVILVYILNQYVDIDYGFCGILAPVVVSLVYPIKGRENQGLKGRYRVSVQVLLLGLVLFAIGAKLGGFNVYLYIALPLLLLYSGERGKYKMKYFFYVFYPTHLVILQLICYLIEK